MRVRGPREESGRESVEYGRLINWGEGKSKYPLERIKREAGGRKKALGWGGREKKNEFAGVKEKTQEGAGVEARKGKNAVC